MDDVIEQNEIPPLADGVYFGLDEDVYHAQPRLSASGIKQMMASPADFWANSWMNPEKESGDTPARILGRAYHSARLEPHLFHERFCRELEASDIPGALMTDSAVKEALGELEQAKSKAGENAPERAVRLMEAGYTGKVWLLEYAAWKAGISGKTAIAGKYWDQITADLELITKTPEVAARFGGGQAEVSVLWTCAQSGVSMKCRIDYLTAFGGNDYKTFDNPNGKPLRRCVADAMRYNRYYIQAVVNREAILQIVNGLAPVEATPEQLDLIAALRTNPRPPGMRFTFQQKGGVPNLISFDMDFWGGMHSSLEMEATGIDDETVAEMRERYKGQALWVSRANHEIGEAKRAFALHMEVYGETEPWRTINPIGVIGDADFNSYWLDMMDS